MAHNVHIDIHREHGMNKNEVVVMLKGTGIDLSDPIHREFFDDLLKSASQMIVSFVTGTPLPESQTPIIHKLN